jgi:hypothetical protein
MLEAIPDALTSKSRELIIRAEPGEVTELVIRFEPSEVAGLAKAQVRQIRESMQSKRLYEVNEQQLELFVCRMFSVVDKVGIETVTLATNEVVRDLVNAETLLQLPEETTPDLTEMVERCVRERASRRLVSRRTGSRSVGPQARQAPPDRQSGRTAVRWPARSE